MRSGRMARRLVATAGMGAILAMGVLTACAKEAPAPETVTKTVTETAAPPAAPAPPPRAGADGEVDQPDRRQPVHAPSQSAAGTDGTSWRSPQ